MDEQAASTEGAPDADPLEGAALALVSARPGLTARQIARDLGVSDPEASAVLWDLRGRGLLDRDGEYRWSPAQERPAAALARLCDYYLDCLGAERPGGWTATAGPGGAVELPGVPGEGAPLESMPGAREFLAGVRRAGGGLSAAVGHPVRVRRRRAGGSEKVFLDPVLVFPVEGGDGPAALSEEPPHLNAAVVGALSADGGAAEEGWDISEALGLYDPSPPPAGALAARLRELRPDWDWAPGPAPGALGDLPDGIHDRTILFAAEAPHYTRGLERELADLRAARPADLARTALGHWLGGEPPEADGEGPSPLLEPLRLNPEQRGAVRAALRGPLTVITGPPGTGKSQVVADILVNAAAAGKRVLFASKNNKAVDVVEARVNALGPRPLLLRLGRSRFSERLADHLAAALATDTADGDGAALAAEMSEVRALAAEIARLEGAARAMAAQRNRVERLAGQASGARERLGEARFAAMAGQDPAPWEAAAGALEASLAEAARQLAGRVLPRLFAAPAMARARAAARAAAEAAARLGVGVPVEPPGAANLPEWAEAAARLRASAAAARLAHLYHSELAALSAAGRPEEIVSAGRAAAGDLEAASRRAWELWLRQAPARLDAAGRRAAADLASVLRLMVSSEAGGRGPGPELRAEYRRLFPLVGHLLPCWAITNLSARGRLPLQPGFFDLVVFDEASQCDAASALPLLYRARAACVLGDPMQLRFVSSLAPWRDRAMLGSHGLLRGGAGWAYSQSSLFDVAAARAGGGAVIMLRDHHRSHDQIIGFSNGLFYGDRLRIATRPDRLPRPPWAARALEWVAVAGEARRGPEGSAENPAEARAVAGVLGRLASGGGFRGSVGVVTPFRAQASLLLREISGRPDAGAILALPGLLVESAHKFQGDERDAMVFSPVAARGLPEGAARFLRRTAYLSNVAITRARALLVVVGDPGAGEALEIPHLAALARYASSLPPADGEGPTVGLPAGGDPEAVSGIEAEMGRLLREAGIAAVPQFPAGGYRIDLAVVGGGARLAIEVDGEGHHLGWDGEILRSDQVRTARLQDMGWDVMRLWAGEVRDRPGWCVARVAERLGRRGPAAPGAKA